ncbi:MAG: NHL repeat-containing protein [bacterium]
MKTNKRCVVAFLLMVASSLPAKDLGLIHSYLILGGTQGNQIEQFNEPDAVAFMRDGRLLAGDTVNGRFKMYTFSETTLSIVAVGSPGGGDCQFDNSLEVVLESGREIYNEVQGISCNSKDEIFVVDQGNRRILVFDATGTCLPERTIALEPILIKPDPENGTTYTSIQGLTVDGEDNLYLTDTGTRTVYKFLPDGTLDPEFEFQARQGTEYILDDPESMVIHQDWLYVADEGHHVIRVYERKSGKFTGKTIGHPDLFGADVEGLAIHNSHLFALNEASGQVVIFDLRKNDPSVVAQFGQTGVTPGRFLSPDGLAISPDGKYLAVADQGNFRIQIFLLEEIESRLGH